MRKWLVSILFMFAFAFPLMAQATAAPGPGSEYIHTVQVTAQATPAVMQATKQPGEPSYALIGPGSGDLFESEPATVVAASGACGSCHSVKGEVSSDVSGGGVIGGRIAS